MTFWDHPSYLAHLDSNMRKDQDNCIAYTGNPGSGKSNTALWDAILLNEMQGRRFDPEKETVFGFEDWNEVFQARERQRVYLFDEAINTAFSRDASVREQKTFVKTMAQARILRSTIQLCLPYFQNLDPFFRNARVTIRVHMTRETDIDIPCSNCGKAHEKRKATYLTRQSREDYYTGETVTYWNVAFEAYICPLRALRPQVWESYETRKVLKTVETVTTPRWRTRSPKKLELLKEIETLKAKALVN